jgi:hypothetical protein
MDQDKNQWLTVVNKVMNLVLPSDVRNFSNNTGIFNFSRHLRTDILNNIVKRVIPCVFNLFWGVTESFLLVIIIIIIII